MSKKSAAVRFLISDALSLIGNSVAAVVLPLLILARTGDPLAAGTLALACAIPQALMGVLGGVVLDKINRRLVSVVSDCISALSIALLLVVDLTIGLSFGWFVALGILGAIGDIPGTTARETLSPDVAEHSGVDLQRFIGIEQSLQSLSVVIGPAVAALLIGCIGDTLSLTVTAALSLSAALVTLTLPRKIGVLAKRRQAPEDASDSDTPLSSEHPLRVVGSSLREGFNLLFHKDRVVTVAFVLLIGISMIIGSYQGLVLPVFFTDTGQPELLGYVLSALSLGLLLGSIVYSVLAARIKRHTWFVLSFAGMALGMVILGLLPAYPLLLLGAALLGAASGPVSALFGLLFMERIPEDKRGSAFGMQNSSILLIVPAAIFASSVLVTMLGTQNASFVLIGMWIAVTLFALTAKSMRRLDG